MNSRICPTLIKPWLCCCSLRSLLSNEKLIKEFPAVSQALQGDCICWTLYEQPQNLNISNSLTNKIWRPALVNLLRLPTRILGIFVGVDAGASFVHGTATNNIFRSKIRSEVWRPGGILSSSPPTLERTVRALLQGGLVGLYTLLVYCRLGIL